MRGAWANGAEIQGLRLARGMTQEQLADLAGIDVKTLRKAEGSKRLDLGSLTKIGFALQTDLKQIMVARETSRDIELRRRDIVMQWQRAWDAQDLATLLSLYHDDAELKLPGAPDVPFGGVFRGKPQIQMAHEIAWSTCETKPVGMQDFVLDVSDEVAVFQGVKGIKLPNGEFARLSSVQVFRFDGELILTHHVEYDTLTFARLLALPHNDQPSD